MKDNFDLEVKKILKEAENEMYDLNHPYVGSEHMLLGILKISKNLKDLLENYDLTYDNFKEELINIVGTSHRKSEIALYTPLLKRIIADAIEEANESNGGIVKPEHLLIGMLEEGEGVGIRILINMDINIESIYNDLVKNTSGPQNKNSILFDIGKPVKPVMEEHIYKREKEIEEIIEILLRKNKNNPLLLGEAGVGKTAIVEELARRIESGEVPDNLLNSKIIEIDTGSLISGTRYRGEFEDRLNKIIKATIKEKNIILFIDEIHTLVNCGGAEGAVDAANILKPYLARGSLKVIGATTLREYKMTIYKDKALERRFQTINVEEPSLEDTEYILHKIKPNYEKHHGVQISEENIKSILKYTEKYIHSRFNPDKSIDILDSVCAHVQLTRPNKKNLLRKLNEKKNKFLQEKKYREALEIELKIKDLEKSKNKIKISDKDILKVVELRANMPIMDVFQEKISFLPIILKEKIYGQDEAIDSICNAIKEKYTFECDSPLALLLEGPSGVGKTFLAKEIAENLFGKNHLLRLDMNELSNEGITNKLLGTTQGYVGYEDECLLNSIKDYPYSLILLDNFDKSSLKVQNIFKEILENGTIRNGRGEIIHFENTTIIMTTKTKSQNSIGFQKETNDNTTKSDNLLKNYINKSIKLSIIDKKVAKEYIKANMKNVDISKKEIDQMIENAKIETQGIRGIQKEINKYKMLQFSQEH